MNQDKFVRNKSVESNRLVWGMLAAFMVAVLITAYLTFIFVRSIFASGETPVSEAPPPAAEAGMPSISIDQRDLNRPLQANGPAGQAWDTGSRITILLLGLDAREWTYDEGPSRTDSMILITVDPASRSGGILSIPRDLWVDIPGYGHNKINTAYFLGEGYQEPGGGAGLAMRTVEEFLGVPVNFYAQVDFSAFEKFIDEIGGIEVEVSEAMSIDPLGPNNKVDLDVGLHHLDGPQSLAFARARNTLGSDFDRAVRQHQVILAIRDRILSVDMLPTLIQKSPVLYYQLKSGVHTNLTLDQIISLAWIANQIPDENIKRGAIGLDHAEAGFSWDGMYILRPLPTEVRMLRDEIFSASIAAVAVLPPIATPTAAGDPEELRQAENARVSVLNGTFTPGLAAETTTYLNSMGINVTQTGNAQEPYELTTIVEYTGKIYTRDYLVDLMGIESTQVFSSYDPNSPVDIAIYLGKDWAANNPIP
jgi:polyisoprenyl-teichoic acid--peptidoglycan teichoic acid transferase